MHTIISIVGKSGSGKTTMLEVLIAELKRRGLKIAIVKHSHHADDLDTAEKDTWRFTRAGAEVSAINSLDNLAVFRRMDRFFDPQEISRYLKWDYDVILTEGFKSSHYPKIEVHRRELGPDLVTDPQQLLAVITDEPLKLDVPQFSRDELSPIADLIESRVRDHQKQDDIDVVVNGDSINLNAPLKDLLARTLLAMIPLPRDDGDIKSVHLSLRRKA